MENLDFRSLVDNISTSILIAKPVPSEDGSFSDFVIIYQNDAFKKITANLIKDNDRISQIELRMSNNIDWLRMATDAIKTNSSVEYSFFSDVLNCWFQAVVCCVLGNYAALTLTDISVAKEYEKSLSEQNKKLESLTLELSKSQSNLDLQLSNIRTLNEQLLFAAYHDTLTNLTNRAWLSNHLKECIHEASTAKSRFAVIFLDIDNMKNINDSRGHSIGDEYIRQVATLLRMFESKNITLSRFGGDEFIVVYKNIREREDAAYTARKIRDFLNAEGIGISGGISVYPEDADNVEDLIKYADMAKSDAKKNGKNSITVFHSLMQEKFISKLNIENKLSKAMADKVFQLYYQPQFDAATEELRGFEALLRWHDDDLGWISPEQFIPLAEETHLVIPLGEWVMNTALETLADWEKRFNFDGIISVNVSPIQFSQSDYLEKFIRKVNLSGINTKHLEVEITEGILIDNPQEIIGKLQKIRDMGIGVSLDDFGTGYSSLRYLQILPLTTLKIDKSFVSNIAEKNAVEASITESIVSLVSKMGWDTIAEGVETEGQLDMLKKLNCRTIQGYLRGKPMPRSLCEKMLDGDLSAVLTIKNS